MQIKIKEITTSRLVKYEDLNHHFSIFVGKAISYLSEAAFIAAAKLVDPKYLKCIHFSEMSFKSPIYLGDILDFTSKVIHAGRTSLTVYVKMTVNDKFCGDGFLTFVKVVDEKSEQHNIELIIETEEDRILNEKAKR